jgi:hypothetical protein
VAFIALAEKLISAPAVESAVTLVHTAAHTGTGLLRPVASRRNENEETHT